MAKKHKSRDLNTRRRKKLTALEEAIDVSTQMDRQKAIRALLISPLIVSTNQSYGLVRSQIEWLREWFAHHADWQLTISADAVRLRKTPAVTDDSSRPCRDPKTGTPLSRRGYVYLCLAMATLVRSDRQTTLGNLSQELASHVKADARFEEAGIRIELDTRDERRELVGVIRLLLHWGVLTRVQGDEEKFLSNASVDVLYSVNNSVLARIMAASTAPSLSRAATFPDRLSAIHEQPYADNEEARRRRYRTLLFRRLLDDPIVYFDNLSPDEKDYFDRQKNSILREIEQATGLVREVRAEGVAMVDLSGKLTDYRLPEEGTEGHLTVLLAEHLASFGKRDPGAGFEIEKLIKFTRKQIKEHSSHWRKNVVDPGQDKILTMEVLSRLTALNLVEISDHLIVPRPALGRYAISPEAKPATPKIHQPELI